jgi:hypothetical protein
MDQNAHTKEPEKDSFTKSNPFQNLIENGKRYTDQFDFELGQYEHSGPFLYSKIIDIKNNSDHYGTYSLGNFVFDIMFWTLNRFMKF